MSIPSNNSSTSLESAPIPGLSTPQVNNIEFDETNPQETQGSFTTVIHKDELMDDQHVKENNENVISVFDVALDIEDKLNEILKQLDKTDKEINERMDNVASRLSVLEGKLSQPN